jgi:hypothetical protein
MEHSIGRNLGLVVLEAAGGRNSEGNDDSRECFIYRSASFDLKILQVKGTFAGTADQPSRGAPVIFSYWLPRMGRYQRSIRWHTYAHKDLEKMSARQARKIALRVAF